MKMKNCELCKGLARMHCESDGASLCWSCDYTVHSANFLVARHSRTLLCRVCQSPTPWTATGLKLGPTVSVCDSCARNYNKINAYEECEATNEPEDVQTEMESDNFDDDEEEDDEDEEYDEEEDTDCEENQVVPWSPSTPPPSSAANSPSNSDKESFSSSSTPSRCDPRETQRKRMRESAHRCYNVSPFSQGNADTPPTKLTESATVTDGYGAGEGRVDLVDSLSTRGETALKKQRIGIDRAGIPGSRSWAVIESVKRLHLQEMRSNAAIAELRRLSEDPLTVDYASSESS